MGVQCQLLLIVFIGGCWAGSMQPRQRRQVDASDRAEGERITATGGGVVRQGRNVTLSLYVGGVWDRCRWFRYDHAKADAKHDYDTCSFDFDEDTNTSSLHKCDNPEMKAMITPLSDDPNSCKVMLVNMSSDMEGKWAARLDTDMVNKEIQLIMEADVESIEVDVDDETVIAGDNVTVICKAVGGKPDPAVMFMLMNADNTTENTTEERFTGVHLHTKDDTSVTYHATFVPEITDLGKSLCCKAVQIDNENVTLYETNKVLERVLNVKFPPQPIEPDGLVQSEAKIGEAVTMSLLVKSNPAPEKAVWSIARTENCGEDDISNTTSVPLPPCTFTLSAGHDDGKYKASNISSVEGEANMFKIELQVLSVETLDYGTNYTLTLTNTVGKQTYDFLLTENLPSTTEAAEKEVVESTSSQETEEETESDTNPGVVVLLVIFVLMGVISGIVFYKKRQRDDIEQTPLTNTH